MHVAINAQLVSFSASYRNAGVSRYTYLLVDGLAHHESDQRYSVFVTAQDAASAGHFETPRLRLVPSKWPTAYPAQRILWEQLALPATLRRRHVDVFHSPVNVLPLRLTCPSVVTIHDLAFLSYPQFFRPARRVYQRALTTRSARRATLVLADSESTKQDIVARLGVPSSRVRVVYPAIDPKFRPMPDPHRLAAFRQEHDLPERFLLYLGTLEPRKNLVGLIEAYAALRSQEVTAPPLVIAGGKGWYYDALFAKVRELNLERAVTFAGYVRDEEQALWYAAAELFIYPSLFEGFGLPVAEAMACGTPVVTSNASSLPEVAGNAAILADPRQPVALAHAMQSVLASDETRRRLAAEGPLWVRRFSVERLITGCTEVYDEAASHVARRHAVEVG
ncbi:MAG TPA: glycosyltransferase family 1 protein [Ktedonobacterales bacterium]